jgi:hypothetical protein
VIREALKRAGLDQKLLRHGISREVYVAGLAPGWREYLRDGGNHCLLERPDATTIARAVVARWVVPRALRVPEYAVWTRDDLWRELVGTGLSVVH